MVRRIAHTAHHRGQQMAMLRMLGAIYTATMDRPRHGRADAERRARDLRLCRHRVAGGGGDRWRPKGRAAWSRRPASDREAVACIFERRLVGDVFDERRPKILEETADLPVRGFQIAARHHDAGVSLANLDPVPPVGIGRQRVLEIQPRLARNTGSLRSYARGYGL